MAKPKGGYRPNSGRKSVGVETRYKTFAENVLNSVNGEDIARQILLSSELKSKTTLLIYLLDRILGKPAQTIVGDAEKPLTITLNWGSNPDWLPKP